MVDAQVYNSLQTMQPHWEKSHEGRFENLLKTGFLSDVNLIVGPCKKPFKAHKLIIATGSPVLYQVVTKSNETSIVIDNVEPDIFLLFLKFLYTGGCELKVEEALPLLQLAVTYQVFDLYEKCQSVLKEDLTDQNAVRIFQQAIYYKEKKLTEKALRYVCRNAWNIIETDYFMELTRTNLKRLLFNDQLLVLNEVQLITGIMRWAKTECTRQRIPINNENVIDILGDMLKLISWNCIDPKRIENQDAAIEIEKVFSAYVRSNTKQIVGNVPRKYFEEDETLFTMSRLPHKFAYCTDNKRGDWEVINFRTDRSICLVSVGIPAYSQTCGDHFNVELKISDPELKSDMVIEEKVPHSTEIFHVKFSKPYKIRKDAWYTISACITGTPGYGNTGGKPLVASKCNQPDGTEATVKFEFKTMNGLIDDISVGQGQVDEFSFKLAEN